MAKENKTFSLRVRDRDREYYLQLLKMFSKLRLIFVTDYMLVFPQNAYLEISTPNVILFVRGAFER